MFCPACGKDIHDESAFCMGCGKPISGGPNAAKKEPFRFSFLKALFLVIVGSIAYGVIVHAVTDSPQSKSDPVAFAAQVLKKPQSQALADGYFEIGTLGSRYWTFKVEPSMMDAKVMGHFSATGGFGNDIQVALGETDEILNWINHHPARLLLTTPEQTAGSFDVPITRSGSYSLALYNGKSLFGKTVSMHVDLKYLTY